MLYLYQGKRNEPRQSKLITCRTSEGFGFLRTADFPSGKAICKKFGKVGESDGRCYWTAVFFRVFPQRLVCLQHFLRWTFQRSLKEVYFWVSTPYHKTVSLYLYICSVLIGPQLYSKCRQAAFLYPQLIVNSVRETPNRRLKLRADRFDRERVIPMGW